MSCLRDCGCKCNEGGCGCHDGEQFNIRVVEIRIPFKVELAVEILGGLVVSGRCGESYCPSNQAGEVVVCPNCGDMSLDDDVCDSCGEMFHIDTNEDSDGEELDCL